MSKTLMLYRGYRFGIVSYGQANPFYTIHTPTGHSEQPIFYGNGKVGYDNPELIPLYIQKEVKRIYYT